MWATIINQWRRLRILIGAQGGSPPFNLTPLQPLRPCASKHQRSCLAARPKRPPKTHPLGPNRPRHPPASEHSQSSAFAATLHTRTVPSEEHVTARGAAAGAPGTWDGAPSRTARSHTPSVCAGSVNMCSA
jgi:hypothetical protein